MHKTIKAACAIAVICLSMVSGYLCGVHHSERTPENDIAASASCTHNSVDAFRTERQQLRQMQLSQLNEIIHSGQSNPEITGLAQKRQLELLQWSEQEQTIEGVLRMRDFDDAVVTIHTDSVNVLVRAESVSSQEASIILELVTRETGISAGNVKIIPLN